MKNLKEYNFDFIVSIYTDEQKVRQIKFYCQNIIKQNKLLYYPFPQKMSYKYNNRKDTQKVSNRKISSRKNPYKQDTSFKNNDIVTTVTRPFSRKPINQASQPMLHSHNQTTMDASVQNIDTSIIDTQSIVSGKDSSTGAKFVRTSKMGILSPKSRRNDSVGKSSLKSSQYGTQSMFLKVQSKIDENQSSNNTCYNLIDVKQIESDISQGEDDFSMHKSISSNNIAYKKSNITKNMILSKFQRKKSVQPSNKERKKQTKNQQQQLTDNSIKNIRKFQDKIIELQRKNNQQQKQTNAFKKSNNELKEQIIRLKRRIQTLKKDNQGDKLMSKSSSVSNLIVNVQHQNSAKMNAECSKCLQKQKSNQRQVVYFENIVRKKDQELTTLKYSLNAEKSKTLQLERDYNKTFLQLSQMLESQKSIVNTQKQLNSYIDSLKDNINHLQSDIRYLQIENSVLLKIKNQNLKLKIDITKIQDERDYFKMKIIQIHRKSGFGFKSLSSSFSKEDREHFKRCFNSPNVPLKKFYLQSTQTEESDGYHRDQCKNQKNQKKLKKSSLVNKSNNNHKNQNNNYFNRQADNSNGGNYADALFDLTSEESQNFE